MREIPRTWRDIVEIARWTPSPHNTQPWRLRAIDDHTAELSIIRARMLPDEDTTGCFIRCAMGMFVESISIVARAIGLWVGVAPSTEPESAETIPFARLTLTSAERGSPPEEFPPGAILDRRTSRLPPESAPIPETDLENLRARARAGGQSLTWTDDPAVIGAVMGLNLDAVCHDLNDRRYGDEIRRWFRFGRWHADRKRDGLDARCMRVPVHELLLIAHAPGLLTWPLTRGFFRRTYANRIGPVRQLAFLAGPFFDPPGAAEAAGRGLMRLWLAMHALGIAIHPFGNLVTNPVAHRGVAAATGTQGIWLVFRIGRTATPPRSARLETESVLCAGR